jgi:hypothetical protein
MYVSICRGNAFIFCSCRTVPPLPVAERTAPVCIGDNAWAETCLDNRQSFIRPLGRVGNPCTVTSALVVRNTMASCFVNTTRLYRRVVPH